MEGAGTKVETSDVQAEFKRIPDAVREQLPN